MVPNRKRCRLKMLPRTRLKCLERFLQKAKRKELSSCRYFCNDNTLERYAECEPRVFSGIQPTGVPHLGNYVGAISNWIHLQKTFDSVLISIVDLHSITIEHDGASLRENILIMAAALIACGIDPKQTILFQQSMVPYHAELSWIFGCLVSLNRLKHVPQWKEKSVTVKEPSVGLYTYPILQAADIMLYKGTNVPVGEDQRAHLDLARELAASFNRIYGTIFPKCHTHAGAITKIRSLKKATSKMSKSEESAMTRIDLTDDADLVCQKIRGAVTDSVSKQISYDPVERPGVSNLIDIHSALTGDKPETIVQENQHVDKMGYKLVVADVVNQTMQPIRTEMMHLLGDKQHLLQTLDIGAERAATIAEATMKQVKQLTGMR